MSKTNKQPSLPTTNHPSNQPNKNLPLKYNSPPDNTLTLRDALPVAAAEEISTTAQNDKRDGPEGEEKKEDGFDEEEKRRGGGYHNAAGRGAVPVVGGVVGLAAVMAALL